MRHQLIFCISTFLILLTSACRHRSDPPMPVELPPAKIVDKPGSVPLPTPTTPFHGEVLPINLKIASYDATKRCAALEEFSRVFARTYGNEATISDWTCDKFMLVRDLFVSANFKLNHKTRRTDMRYLITINDLGSNIDFAVDSTSYGDGFYKNLAELNPQLSHWKTTLQAVLDSYTGKLKVFDRSPSEFADAVAADLKTAGLKMKAKDGVLYGIKITLKPTSPQNKSSGTVHFDEVPAPLFTNNSETPPNASTNAGSIVIDVGTGMLGCSDLACLNDGSVAYSIGDEFVAFSRDIPSTGSSKKTSFTYTSYSSFPETKNP